MAETHMKLSHPEYQKNLSAQIKKLMDHMLQAKIAREARNWELTLLEANAAMAAGAYLSPPVTECSSRIKFHVLFTDQIFYFKSSSKNVNISKFLDRRIEG
jgi:DNA-binding LytR/AlgR family response regulator